MTRLFLQFYLGVLAVLLGIWYIHGVISERQIGIEIPRIVEVAHRGGARLLAERLNEVSREERPALLRQLRQEFGFTQRDGIPVRIISLDELPEDAQQRIAAGEDAVYNNGVLATPLASGTDVLQLGPFPQFTHYEKALRGSIHLAIAEIENRSDTDQNAMLAELRQRFGYGIEQIDSEQLPDWERLRIGAREAAIFYVDAGEPFVLAPLADRSAVFRFGPLPDYGGTEQKILAKSTAIVLLVTAFAIAVLLRPIAGQLRRVEDAARAFSTGDLAARVDESKTRSARPLAEAFNHMANRTETLLRTQREILQTVSHELRTPLSRIRFAIDLIENAKDDDERTKRLNSLDAATTELDDLVGELLRYVRLESTDLVEQREALSIGASLETLADTHAGTFPNVSFSIGGEFSGETANVFVNSAAFHRAIGNLLRNSGRFAKSQVTISASCETEMVTVSVDDDGPGVPPEDRERIFEPFTRLNGNVEAQGVGLGLAIVRRIVTQHGGNVSVHSSSSGGCRIETTWPKPRDDVS